MTLEDRIKDNQTFYFGCKAKFEKNKANSDVRRTLGELANKYYGTDKGFYIGQPEDIVDYRIKELEEKIADTLTEEIDKNLNSFLSNIKPENLFEILLHTEPEGGTGKDVFSTHKAYFDGLKARATNDINEMKKYVMEHADKTFWYEISGRYSKENTVDLLNGFLDRYKHDMIEALSDKEGINKSKVIKYAKSILDCKKGKEKEQFYKQASLYYQSR